MEVIDLTHDEQFHQENDVLGLDVNTKSTGYCLINSSGSLKEYGVICRPPGVNALEYANVIKIELQAIVGSSKSTKVFVERMLLGFTRSRTNTRSLGKLSELNGMVQLIAYEMFGFVRCVDVKHARRIVGIEGRVDRHKSNVVKHFENNTGILLGHFSRGKQSDIADAYVMAKYGCMFNEK